MTGNKRPTMRGHSLPFLAALLSGISATLLFGGRDVLPQAAAARASAATPAASAAGGVLYVPASAHASGANGSNWRTDVEVHNPGAGTASFTVQLLLRDADNSSSQSRSYTLGAQQARRFTDFLVSEFGTEGAAALRVTASSGLVVTSRTYNFVGQNPWSLPQGASFGQFVPGYSESEAIGYGQEGRLIQLTQQASATLDGFRTNLGIVNTTGIPIGVRIDLYKADGTYLGKKDGTETNLPPYGFRQLDQVFSAWGSVADGYAVVRTTTPGGGLFAFATVVDNHNSGDPIFVPAMRLASSGLPPTATPTPTVTPATGSSVDLAPYKPSTWENPLVPSNQKDALSTTQLVASLPTYVRWAVANNGPADIAGTIFFELRIDGVPYTRWRTDSGLKGGYYAQVENYEIPPNTLSSGAHTLTIVADPDNTIVESNETNNSWGKTWEWVSIFFVRGGSGPAATSPVQPRRTVPELELTAGSERPVEGANRGGTGAGLAGVERVAAASTPIYVPASAHASGMNGSSWRTDVEVHNPGTTGVTFTIELLRQGNDNRAGVPVQTFSLGPQQGVRYVDILSTVFGTDGAASLRLMPQSGTILVNSRTYNLIGPNGVGLPVGASFGQFVPGLSETEAIGFGEEGRIIQLTHRDASSFADFRTNAGFVNTTGSPIDIRIDLFSASGSLLGTIQDSRTHLRAYESLQINGIFGEFTDWLEDGYVVLRTTTAGGRFFAFATVVDNHLTGDPIFIPAVRMAGSTVPPTPTPTPTATPTPTPTPTPGGITVTINPGAATLQPGGRQTFRATVMGTTNTGVTWKVAEGTAGGTIDGQGSYTAPATSGIYNVVATSQADSTKSGSAYVMVSTTVPDAEYAPKPTVTGTTTTETKSLTTTPNVKGTLTLSDGTKVEISPLPSAVTVTLTRSTNTLDAVRAAGQETSGAMRTVTFTGDSASLDFVPTITIPAAEAGSLSALNVARVGPVAQGGQVQNDMVMFLPVARDASGNMVVRDIYLRGAARIAPASVAPSSAGRAALGIMATVKSRFTLSTYQTQINWEIEPQLVRMIPDHTLTKRKPLSTLPQSQQDEILRKPIQNVIVLVHGHNEAELYGFEPATAKIEAPWLMEAKRDTWTLLYDNFQSLDKDYLDCTAFYEYIYPTYRPVFDGPGELLGTSLKRLIAEDPRLKKLTNKYNLFFVAHSMGGLVARSAINQLPFADPPNFEKLVTWGTPHHGSPLITMRYLLTSGYNLEVPNMCAIGSWLPLETFNQFSLYHGYVTDTAIDTPGERELRWDNYKPLNLEKIGWTRAVWQVGDDKTFDPATNPYLYNYKLADFNSADKYRLSDKYVALYGITTKIAPIDLTDCNSLHNFYGAAPIAQGNGIIHWVYNNPATLDPSLYPGTGTPPVALAVKESDGAVSVDSMVGLGVFSAFKTWKLGDTDHEEYYGAPAADGSMKQDQKDKGDKTAVWTLGSTGLNITDSTKKCDCPTLVVDKVESAGSTSNISATLTWPGDLKPGQRVQGIASARGEGASRVVTPARSFTAPDNGKLTAVFDTSTLTPASSAEKIFLLAQMKDGSELSAPVSATPAPLFNQALIAFHTEWGTYRYTTGVEFPGSVSIAGVMPCRGAITGLTFSCSWSAGGSTGQITVVLNSTYDTVLTFALDQVETYYDSTRTMSLAGGNVPYSSEGSRFAIVGSVFSLDGSSACSHITKAVFSNTSPGISYTLVSYLCTESSNLSISLIP
jgi:hypothetical protein